MKNTTFTLTNKYVESINFQLEPEAIIHKLTKNESIKIEVTPSDGSSIDIQVNKLNEHPGFYLSIWHDQGEYRILFDDE